MSSFDILSRKTPLKTRLFLEASAGTGKTFTIEHLVVRLLLETQYTLDQILVVTFTKAATRELKVRIRSNLEKILSGEETFDYLSGLTEEKKERIKTALLTFEKAQIFTIHGFCHRLLQEFAFEASVGLDLEEWEDREEKWAVLQFLRSTKELSHPQLKRLLGSFRNDMEKLVDKLLASSESKVKVLTYLELLQKANQSLSTLTPFSVLDAFALARPHYKGLTSEKYDAQAALLDQAVNKGSLLPEEWDQLMSEEDLFLEKIVEENLKARTKFTGHPALQMLRSVLFSFLELARDPSKIFQTLAQAWHQERKKLSRLYEKVSPDDLLKMVQERLSDPLWIEKVRKKYQAVIVDEFQDTDPIQWKIFETLFFADPAKAVYLVGDPKQSIYAFRHADIYTFLKAAHGFDTTQKAALTTNYRSTQKLLDALNRLLCEKPWMDLPKLKAELLVSPVAAAKEGDGELCMMIVEGGLGRAKRWPTPEIEQKFFSYLIHEIQRHPLDPKEVAVLVKDRYQALRVKNALDQYNIPCVLYRGGSLGDSIVIELLLELMGACDRDDSLSSIKKVLLGPFVRLPIEQLTDEVAFQAKAIFAELSSVWLKNGFSVFLAQFFQTIFWKTTVFHTLSFEEVLVEDLMQIVEKILHIHDPHQMSQALRLLKIQEVDERISAHPHGVQIVTIHASKGLEFETVFALGLASRTTAEEMPEEELKELDAEKMRQLYVALTRAKQRLYIPVAREMSGKPLNLGEAAPIELFLERAQPDLHSFTHVYLNTMEFHLNPFQNVQPTPVHWEAPKPRFFKPFFLQSFTSLAQNTGERKIVPDDLLPSSAETGIVIHRILERFFDQSISLSDLITQEIKGSHLEEYGSAIETMLKKVLDLPLTGFCLRDLDKTHLLPEMEFLFPTQGTALKGFIDLAFEHQGKFYLIDWKTNVLESYTQENLEKAMKEHDYLLQGKIYATAYTRFLKLYDSPAFGGIFFLFVRGPAFYHFIPEVFDV